MSAGWTPGPWAASLDDVPYAEFEGVAWQVNSDEGSICTVDSPAVIAEANAHLIAAAPDGYEFADAFIAYVERSDLDDIDFGRGIDASGLIGQAKAFLAKARAAHGETL